MRLGTICVGVAVAVSFVMACGGSRSSVQQPAGAASGASTENGAPAAGGSSASAPSAAPANPAATGASASSAPAPAGAAASSVGSTTKPGERPFARTSIEAQSLIQSEIDARMKPLWKCVEAYRTKKRDPHKAVVVEVGIDQEGNLLGVTAANAKKNGELDPALRDCMLSALRGAPFPRSHAGVISVRQTFSDETVYPQ